MKRNVVVIILMIIVYLLIFSNSVFSVSGKITATTVRLRKNADSSSDTLKLIDYGKSVEILGEDGDWYKVKFEDLTGYISKKYVKVSGEVSSNDNR